MMNNDYNKIVTYFTSLLVNQDDLLIVIERNADTKISLQTKRGTKSNETRYVRVKIER